MQLIGRYLSPFVRRVGTTLNLYEIPFEHRPLATMGEDRATIRESNPVTRVPALVLDSGETLVDSAAILDYLDEQVGPERALTPANGPRRRQVMKLMAIAVGAAEKSVLTVYEKRFRPEEKWHAPWVEMCASQARDGFTWLNAACEGPWLQGDEMTQADVSTVCAYDFVRVVNPELYATLQCPQLDALSQRANELPAFASTRPPD